MYKVTKEVEFDGRTLTLGEEIFLSERDASKLIQDGAVVVGRALDPANKDDADKIKEAEEAHDARYQAGKAKEEARDEQRQEEHKQDDEKRKTLIAEGKQIMKDLADADGKTADKDELAQLERIETPDLEKRVEELRAKKSELESDEEEVEVSEKMTRDELEKIARDRGVSDKDISDASTKADLVKVIEKAESKG